MWYVVNCQVLTITNTYTACHTCTVASKLAEAIRWPPGYCSHIIGMPTIDEVMATVDGIPYLHGLVKTPGGNVLTIRRPGYRIHIISIPTMGEDIASIGRIPHLHGPVSTCRGDAQAI